MCPDLESSLIAMPRRTLLGKDSPGEEGIGSISLAVQAAVQEDGTLSASQPLFQIFNYLDVLGIYQNSFTRSPSGSSGSRYTCSTLTAPSTLRRATSHSRSTSSALPSASRLTATNSTRAYAA